jgi:cathepsin B
LTISAAFAARKTVVNKDMVNYINSLRTTWTASTDQGNIASFTKEEAKVLLGARRFGGPKLPRITYADKNIKAPASFDSRVQWPQCVTIKNIRDQSACGSCWAFGAVEAMSDRYCIHLGMNNLSISAVDLLSCCDECGDGCDGGYPSSAWQYWVDTGLVPESCAPYPFPSCDHHVPNSRNPCPSNEYPTPGCPSSCSNGDNWDGDLHYGGNAYSVSGEADMMTEISTNGPVEVAFDVYEDFLSYKGGVYQHTSGDFLGGHAVKIIGWGVQNGVKYWLVANSWNPTWGLNGFFMIRKGTDECGIEDEADAGTPSK